MENGQEGGILAKKFAGLAVSENGSTSNGNDGLYQVMKAVEAAEATIKQQVEENIRLRSELQEKNEEIKKYKSADSNYQNPHLANQWADHVNEAHGVDQISGTVNGDIDAGRDLVNGSLKVNRDGQVATENSGFSQFVTSPVTSFFSSRSPLEDHSESQLRISGRGLIISGDANDPTSIKQDLVSKLREHEEEIMQLKKHLAEYTVKETQTHNEKYVLEKRISYMRMAFDQQQQDLVEAASKAISYRQDIMEENVHLTYALQAAQQERSTFVSSLMPLLAEYSLQPSVADAQSIVSSVKVLFRHLQEQLLVTEGKLKDSQYQLAPWRSDVNLLDFIQNPVHPIEIKNGLELVTQPTYSNEKTPSSDHQTTDENLLGRPQTSLADDMKNFEHDDLGNYPLLPRRNTTSQETYTQLAVTQTELHPEHNNEEIISKKVTFGDFVRRSEVDESDTRGDYVDRQPSVNWASKAATHPIDLEDPSSSYSPYLTPVLEEPTSSFSEAADDDPPPGIEGLQISGEAYPGKELQACGYSTNGTTSCNFEWVRHLEDGSFNYIDGAKQPNYLVTADDIDTYLAIEVQPLDDRKRKGELVKVFANEHRKITCDPEMLSCIEKTLYSGHASYKLSSSTGFLDIWEPATLSIKRDGYSIKCSGSSAVSVTEKFSSTTIVSIRYGSPTEFSIADPLGNERILKVDNNTTDINSLRDTVVLTLRLFIRKAGEKKKGKKRGFLFK